MAWVSLQTHRYMRICIRMCTYIPAYTHLMHTNTYIDMLKVLTVGDPTSDFQGSLYWVNRLKAFQEKLNSLAGVYSAKLDEKRNFWSFLLTVVSILQYPMEAVTGIHI